MKDMGTWSQSLAEDSEKAKYGYIDITSAAPVAYAGA